MDVNSREKIAKIYSGEVKIANKEDIYNTLLNGDSKAAVAFAIKTNGKIGLNCFKFIIDANTGALIYYAIQEVKSKDQDGFTASDFKNCYNCFINIISRSFFITIFFLILYYKLFLQNDERF